MQFYDIIYNFVIGTYILCVCVCVLYIHNILSSRYAENRCQTTEKPLKIHKEVCQVVETRDVSIINECARLGARGRPASVTT